MANEKLPKVVKHARRGNHRKMVRALERGESSNSTDGERRSALFHASLRGNKACLKELLRRGADPNKKNCDGHTPCHAAAIGGCPPSFPPGIASTRNPFKGAYLCAKGTYNILKYWLHDRRHYHSCLCHLLQYGGDLGVRSLCRETVRDVAVRMRKMKIVKLIEDHYDVEATLSGYNLRKGHSMLRSTASFPRSCPQWMHAVVKSSTVENVSPLHSQASLYQRGRMISHVFDYGYMHAFGHNTNPGSAGSVPEILPAEITLDVAEAAVEQHGSLWNTGHWAGIAVTVRRLSYATTNAAAERIVNEMDQLSVLHHPNIALLMAVCCGPGKADLCLVLEPLDPKSLHDQMHQTGSIFSVGMNVSIALDVASALTYLHAIKGVVHCLISSYSIHLQPNGGAKLVNLHSCHPLGSSFHWTPHYGHFLPWMAPELISKGPMSTACDVYSLGVLIWELWSSTKPWGGVAHSVIAKNIVDGQTLPLMEEHRSIGRLLGDCFKKAELRPTVQNVSTELTHQYNSNQTMH